MSGSGGGEGVRGEAGRGMWLKEMETGCLGVVGVVGVGKGEKGKGGCGGEAEGEGEGERWKWRILLGCVRGCVGGFVSMG